MFLFLSIVLFFLGAVVGSFLNVVIFRTMHDESWVKGRSHCEHCGRLIRWYDNVPLFSYLILNGKCRDCGAPIAMTHPVVEFLTASLFVWWYWGGTLFFRLTEQPYHYIQPIFWLVVGVLLLIIFFADLLYSIIPDEAVIILTALTFAYRLSLTLSHVMQPADFARTLAGAALASGFFWLLWFVTRGKGMGFGDVKLALPMGLLLGWPGILVGLLLSFNYGAMVSIGLLVFKKKKLKQTVPFSPFMVAGILTTLVFGNRLVEWYMHWL